MGKLTAISVKAKTAPGSYHDGDGLMLLVKPSGSRSWQLRVQVDGKRRDFGLGSALTLSLADARAKSAEIRSQFKAGVDPVAKRRADRLASATLPTFRDAAATAHGELVAGWRNAKHRKDWLSSLEANAFPHVGDVRVDLIDAPMVRDLLLPIWLEKPETARRVRQRVKGVLDWAAAKGFRSSLDLSGIGKALPRQPKSDRHFAALPYDDVPAFIRRVRSDAETVGRAALQFTILTAARSGETRGATWREVDLDDAMWTIPGQRMKAGRTHIVPLSKPALAILRRLASFRCNPDAPIFAGKGGKPLSDMTLSKIVRDMEVPVTVHGFRSSFKDWAVESTSFPDAVSEAALAHLDADKVRAAYRRTQFLEMRRDLMEKWGGFCTGGSGTVVQLAASA